jgi:demethylmenaquinone methyltransferase / 2-methoxy-6-polyprenyl-1,4-benzoquinol methylase
MSKKYAHDDVLPNKDQAGTKKEQVAEMFNDIAGKYDFLNRFLSAGIDISWRKKALQQLRALQPTKILDVATGTADVAIMAKKQYPAANIIGIDISDGMLALGRNKIAKLNLQNSITLFNGDSETINYPNQTFNAVTVAFGVRNFENLEKGLSEIYRVLTPGGKLVVLEFSKPKMPGVKTLYNFYMKLITPTVGKIVSKNKTAYAYLDESIQKFPEGNDFIAILAKIGYQQTYLKRLSLGICTIYCGTK